MSRFPPDGCTDCHTHVAGRPQRYAMVSPRAYTPEVADPAQMRAMVDRVGSDRIVLVQMSVYGTDNSCMLDGISALGDCARGVAQVAEDCPPVELDRLHRNGIRGIRVNLNTPGITSPNLARDRLLTAAAQCERNGWHLQLFARADVIGQLGGTLTSVPVPVVFDHFGLLSPSDRSSAAETVVRDLLASGRGWVKLSGSYRLPGTPATEQIADLARDLYRTNPERAVWGSDWPHSPPHRAGAEIDPPPAPYRNIDPADMLATIRAWFDEDADRERILVANPGRLYFG